MRSYEDLMTGLLWLGIGIVILQNWKWLVQGTIVSGNAVWGRLGIPQASEKTRRAIGAIITKFLGCAFILAGILTLYTFFTGHELPSRWEDLWPF